MQEPKILIVDDVPENISALYAFLSRRGFKVTVAPDGESALEMAAKAARSDPARRDDAGDRRLRDLRERMKENQPPGIFR
jgi:CheY-like chemotaxis protein